MITLCEEQTEVIHLLENLAWQQWTSVIDNEQFSQTEAHEISKPEGLSQMS